MVCLSDRLVEGMTLAAVESYALGDGRRRKQMDPSVETYGYVWGYKSVRENETVFFLDRMSISLSSRRAPDSVIPDERAAKLKSNLMQLWSPHLSLAGDFHTHPYKDLAEVKSAKGWGFSEDDIAAFDADDLLWEKSGDTPVNVVIAISKLGRVHESFGSHAESDTVSRYDVGEFRFWIGVNVGYIEDGERKQSFRDGGNVLLNLDTRFSNLGGRIASHIDRD
jgi:hypothetical protein